MAVNGSLENPSDDANEAEEELTIQQASRALRLPAPTIRSWERRYGIPVTGRSRGGHRRYSADQLDMLRRLRDQIARGDRAVEAARRVKAEFNTSPEALVTEFLRAADELRPVTINDILDTAQQALGLDRTVDEVLLPAMRRIGQRWETGTTDVGHEHLATHATQGWLARVSQTGPPLNGWPPIILCCGPRDHHTLGLEAIGALLRQRGWDCRLLGARTPVASLSRVVDETDAAGVILVCHINPGRQAAVEALSTPRLRGTHLFYAGAAFDSRRSRHGAAGKYLGNNLSAAAELVNDTLLSRPPGTDP